MQVREEGGWVGEQCDCVACGGLLCRAAHAATQTVAACVDRQDKAMASS
jgi:hypothetical protein